MKGFHLFLLLSAATIAHAEPVLLLDGPAKITAEVRNSAQADVRTASTAIKLTLAAGTHEFYLFVRQRGSADTALATQKARTGWKEGYLFVRDDCLDANEETRAWRCVVDQVFTFVESREGKRLVHIGDFFSGEECIDAARIGCSLYQGSFTDIHDTFENNSLVSRAESPSPLLEISVANGTAGVDLDATWGRNQERFTAGERCLDAAATERKSICIDGITPRSAYLFNSTLAAYTRRTDQLMRIRAHARRALCENPDDESCSETLRRSALMLASIRPGEKPRPRGSVSARLAPLRD